MFEDQLRQFDQAWRSAQVREDGEYENLPDGKYQARIDEVRFENAKKSGRLQLAWVLQVEAPDQHKGRKIFHYRGLENNDSVKWMKQELFNCGLMVDSISEVPDALKDLLDRIIEVQLKTKKVQDKEYQNVFINKLLSEGGRCLDDEVPF